MKIIVMIDRSVGNDSVGNMWTDTYIYSDETPIGQIFKDHFKYYADNKQTVKENIRIQIGEEKQMKRTHKKNKINYNKLEKEIKSINYDCGISIEELNSMIKTMEKNK